MKKLAFVALLAIGACQPNVKENSDDPEIVARQVFDAFNAHDWAKMESLYADSVILQDPAYPGGKKGKVGITDFYKSVPDIHDEVKNIFARGNQAVIEFVSTGTIDGRVFELPICTVLTIEHGKVIRDNTYYDLQNP